MFRFRPGDEMLDIVCFGFGLEMKPVARREIRWWKGYLGFEMRRVEPNGLVVRGDGL